MTVSVPDRPTLGDLGGLWTRTLFVTASGDHDFTTEVRWLQGASLYGDIRQKRDGPDFSEVRCVRDLGVDHMRWMAEQEAFAGRLIDRGDCFEWERAIDFQPPAARRDRGRLAWVGETVVETGYESPYTEHWRRTGEGRTGTAALLRAPDGRAGIIVRAGGHLVMAKGRPVPLPPAPHLRDVLEATSGVTARQDLFDCEIAHATLSAEGWRIERSTLPFRVGTRMAPRLNGSTLVIADQTAAGEAAPMAWTMEGYEGDVAFLARA